MSNHGRRHLLIVYQYMLDRSRVTPSPSTETNFGLAHILAERLFQQRKPLGSFLGMLEQVRLLSRRLFYIFRAISRQDNSERRALPKN